MANKIAAFLLSLTLAIGCMMMQNPNGKDIFDIGAIVALFMAIGIPLTEIGERAD